MRRVKQRPQHQAPLASVQGQAALPPAHSGSDVLLRSDSMKAQHTRTHNSPPSPCPRLLRPDSSEALCQFASSRAQHLDAHLIHAPAAHRFRPGKWKLKLPERTMASSSERALLLSPLLRGCHPPPASS